MSLTKRNLGSLEKWQCHSGLIKEGVREVKSPCSREVLKKWRGHINKVQNPIKRGSHSPYLGNLDIKLIMILRGYNLLSKMRILESILPYNKWIIYTGEKKDHLYSKICWLVNTEIMIKLASHPWMLKLLDESFMRNRIFMQSQNIT